MSFNSIDSQARESLLAGRFSAVAMHCKATVFLLPVGTVCAQVRPDAKQANKRKSTARVEQFSLKMMMMMMSQTNHITI